MTLAIALLALVIIPIFVGLLIAAGGASRDFFEPQIRDVHQPEDCCRDEWRRRAG